MAVDTLYELSADEKVRAEYEQRQRFLEMLNQFLQLSVLSKTAEILFYGD